MIHKMYNTIEWISYNLLGVGTFTWLINLLDNWSTIIASGVGISVIALNLIKIYGLYLDNKKKKE